MKRQPKLTKRERKALAPKAPAQQHAQHIHCIACGKHLNPQDFEAPAVATVIRCDHGSTFPTCVGCMQSSMALVAEHDRTGNSVRAAAAWH